MQYMQEKTDILVKDKKDFLLKALKFERKIMGIELESFYKELLEKLMRVYSRLALFNILNGG